MKTISQQIQVNFHSVEIEEQLTVMMLMDILQEAIYQNTNLKISINENEYLMYVDRCKATFDILKNLGFISLKTNSKNKDLQDLAKAKENITCDTNVSTKITYPFVKILEMSSKTSMYKILRKYFNISQIEAKNIVSNKVPFTLNLKNYDIPIEKYNDFYKELVMSDIIFEKYQK